MNFIGKLLPVEGYMVVQKGNLPEGYMRSLTHLYQPLIGITAVMLYQTLLHEIELQQANEPQTHHTLMNYLNLPLDDIYRARLKLEGIGLLNTYKHQTDKNDYYTYELLEPFAPGDFFEDAMLTQLLYHHVGDEKFTVLKNHYVTKPRLHGGNNVTAAFHDVFQTFQPQMEPSDPVKASHEESNVQIDFTWMKQMLKQRMIPEKYILTADNRKLISQMMVLYDLAEHEIEKAVMWALTAENKLDTDEFKVACHDLFKSTHQQSVIKLTDIIAKQGKTQVKTKPATKEEQLIYELETISPKQLLEDLSSGNHASEQDMKIIRDVMTTQGLPSPVMNVLIHYVLLQSNMKLSKAYLEKIASHWSRANLQTAKEAMEFAKKEKAKSQAGYVKKQNYRKPAANEVVPDWFKDRKKKPAQPATTINHTETEEEKAEFEALLREFTSKNNHLQG
ncbi:chromosome replication initiation protein [Virgibacillus dakarensis]|uniref:Replication initiation and membrane attachment protein n=1 Tax=Lentibacillus populi TaxID=1827502 RepID=A0A9W5TTQ3_9BACI|nr:MULTISPECIES: DnaD domain protein [Bacillaceae]MBT2218588.1 DnaD domain protein [Virgibacillus dakarensis]MTW84271.1 chromosome replication initiation protein [Virgibacillus dakarensis]GGB27719.1 replication initiation and membrane attachment protein [Lentibacillus populi]